MSAVGRRVREAAPQSGEGRHRDEGEEIEIAFEEPTPRLVVRTPKGKGAPDRAPDSILTYVPSIAEPASLSLRPVDVSVFRGATGVGVPVRPAPAASAKRDRWSLAVYWSCAACAVLLVFFGVRFGPTLVHGVRIVEPAAALGGKSAPATHVVTSSPPASATAVDSTPPPIQALSALSANAPAVRTGTLLLRRPARPGRVWLDGLKITAASTSVACGLHEIRVKGWRKHTIRVPCDGEVRVAR